MSSQAEETDKPLFKWSEFSDAERRLLAEICYHTARILWEDGGKADRTFQTPINHCFLSAYQSACKRMLEVGVFEDLNGVEYKLKAPLEEVREHLAATMPDLPESFDDFLCDFLDISASNALVGRPPRLISDEKEPWDPPGYVQDLMWAFLAAGYAEREAGGFRWTEKIAPHMKRCQIWSKDGTPRTTQLKQRARELADQLWYGMPLWRRHLMARSIVGKDGMGIYMFLLRKWDGDRFRFIPRFPWARLPKSIRLKAIRLRNRLFGFPKSHVPQEVQPALAEIARRLVIVRKSHPF